MCVRESGRMIPRPGASSSGFCQEETARARECMERRDRLTRCQVMRTRRSLAGEAAAKYAGSSENAGAEEDQAAGLRGLGGGCGGLEVKAGGGSVAAVFTVAAIGFTIAAITFIATALEL